MFTLRFDMRAPDGGAPCADLYEAALDIAARAEDRGCVHTVLCEHHGSPDGYLPSPLSLAAAMAARTKRLLLSVAIFQLPLYNPTRLAEDMCVIDIISRGRVSFFGGLGYLPQEYSMHGIDFKRRGAIADAHLTLLLKAVRGEPFDYEGRRIEITPKPYTPGGPRVGWGGGSPPAARRAGRFGLDFMAHVGDPGLRIIYEQACAENGHKPGMCMLPPKSAPGVVFVAEDVDRAWEELGPYLMHDVRSYAAWNEGNDHISALSFTKSVEELRAEKASHRIMSVEEAIAFVRGGAPLPLHPLIGGLPPQIAWRYLHVVTDKVMPTLAQENA